MQHPYEDIVEWYRNLTRDYSSISRFVESIGVSSQGRNIPAVHFSGTETPEYTVYFQCQIHASKWVPNSHTQPCLIVSGTLFRRMDIWSCVHVCCTAPL